MNKINPVEKIISKILIEEDFYSMNDIISKKNLEINKKFLFPNHNIKDGTGFVSIKKNSLEPYTKIMKEDEFFQIVGKTKNGISNASGNFQKYLYFNYLEAVRLNDEGYIYDVLNKALEFKTNLKYIKSLMENNAFASEWRKDFGKKSAIEIYKNKGKMRIINIVKERTL